MKKLGFIVLLILLSITACSTDHTKVKKVSDLKYTVLGNEEQPETLKQIIDEKKEKPFELTYAEDDYLYICVGYGQQNSGGYSIQVEDCYLGEEVIYVNTTLLGPTQEDAEKEEKTYPYIVLKTEYMDKTVVFE